MSLFNNLPASTVLFLVWNSFDKNFVSQPSHLDTPQTQSLNVVDLQHRQIVETRCLPKPNYEITSLLTSYGITLLAHQCQTGTKIRRRRKHQTWRVQPQNINIPVFLKKQRAGVRPSFLSWLFFEKKKISFWPLRGAEFRAVYQEVLLTKTTKVAAIRQKKINNTAFSPLYSFYSNFSKPKSIFHRTYDFSQKTMKFFWKSRAFYKAHNDIKRRWTARKFFYKFSFFLKKNKTINLLPSPYLWQLLLSLGFASSKKETILLFSKCLFYTQGVINPDTHISRLDRTILTFSKDLLSLIPVHRSFVAFTRRRFGKFQKTQYLNRLSQWRSVAKKKPAYINNLLYKSVFTGAGWYLEPLSCSLLFLKNNNNSSLWPKSFLFPRGRHNLERLNLFKLKL